MAAARLAGLGLAGVGGLYALSQCLFNVESGKRGIVYNRIGGIKEQVRAESSSTRGLRGQLLADLTARVPSSLAGHTCHCCNLTDL